MLLRQFKRTDLLTIFLIIVILIALWVGAFAKLKGQFSLYFDLNAMPLYGIIAGVIGTNPLPGIIFSLLLVSLMAFLMVNLNTSLFFINERTFLPALIYVLLSGILPQYQLLNPAIFGAVFLMLAIKRIMEAYRAQGIAYNFFDAGLLIGIGGLFYGNLIWFGLIIIVGIALLRTGNVREIFLSVLGLATPYLLTAAIYYVAGKNLSEFFNLLAYNLFEKNEIFAFSPILIVALIFICVLVLLSISQVFILLHTKKIQARKTFSVLLWVFLISIAAYLFLTSVSVEIIWIAAIPMSYYLSHYFLFTKKKFVPEILFSLLFLLILIIQVRYLY
jgi:hypothetical protein